MRAQVLEDPAPPVKRAYDAAAANTHRQGSKGRHALDSFHTFHAHRQGSGDRPALDSFHTFRTMLKNGGDYVDQLLTSSRLLAILFGHFYRA